MDPNQDSGTPPSLWRKYYARLHLGGKEKWISLETPVLEVAKVKLEEEKQAVATARKKGWEPQAGIVQVQTAIDAFKTNLDLRMSLKASTRQFYLWSLKSILMSWPELPEMDVRHVTEIQCKEWAKRFAEKYSATYYNNAVLVLNAIFEAAIKAGVIYRNPAKDIEMRRKTQKALNLPSRENFFKIVAAVKGGTHRTAKASAELIEFLAYTGCRISEAQRVTCGNCDFTKETILVKGDPDNNEFSGVVKNVVKCNECVLIQPRTPFFTQFNWQSVYGLRGPVWITVNPFKILYDASY